MVRSPVVIYGLTLASVVAAGVVRWRFDPLLGDHLPYVTFFVAVAAASWLGGLRPGLVATLLGFLSASYFFVPPRFSLDGASGPHMFGWAMYFMVSLVLAGFGEAMRRAGRRAEEQRERLQTTLESISDGFLRLDRDWRVVYFNAEAERINGLSRSEAIGRIIWELWPAVVGTALEAAYRKAMAKQVTVELENFYEPWGRWYALKLFPTADNGLSVYFRDVTERRRGEEELRESAARISEFADAAPAILWVTDPAGSCTFLSREWYAFTGQTADEALGLGWTMATHPDDQAEAGRVFLGANQRREEFRMEYLLRGPGGAYRWALDVGRPRFSPAGDYLGMVGVVIDIHQRKLAEEQMRQNEERYRTLFSSMDEGFCVIEMIFDPPGGERPVDYRFVEVNPAFEAQTGMRDAIGKRMLEFVPSIEEHWLANYGSVALTGKPIRFANKFKSLDRWFDVYAFQIGSPAHHKIAVLFTDITARKRAEETLLHQKTLLESLTESVVDGILIVSPEGRMIHQNQTFIDIWNFPPEVLESQSDAAALEWAAGQTADPAAFLARVTSIYDRPDARVREELAMKDGRVYERCGSSIRAGDTRLGWVWTFRDVTDRKRVEEALRAAEEQFRTMAENIPQLAWMARTDGNIYWYNRRWYEYTGTTRETQEGWGWEEVHDPDILPQVRARWQASLATGEPFDMVFPLKGGDGVFRPFLTRVMPVRDAQGQVVQWFGTNTDITEQREMAESLQALTTELSEADHRKDEFLATLAHELRNPLAPLRNGLQVMRLAQEDAEAVDQARTMMERQLDQMVRLVDDLMDVSRISRGRLELKMERVHLAEVLSSALETSRPLIDEMEHELTVTLPEQPIVVDADLTRLAQVFLNLLNNAAKYSEPGGRIWLTAERQGSDVAVSVRDAGIGIAAEQLPRIFEMFSQVQRSLERSQGGLGIGLTLVKRLIEMHGGRIEVRSEGPGKGSEFVVRLPIVVEASVPEAASEDRALSTSALRILVVDDNRDSAASLSMMLKLMGNQTRTVYDGEEAVAAASEFRPEVILLDIGLPKLNGYEACRRIRRLPGGKNIVIVAQTGWGQEDDRQRTHEAGFDHHLVKPIDAAALKILLAELSEAAAIRAANAEHAK